MCDLIFVVESMDIKTYADGTSLHGCSEDFHLIIKKLELKANEILQWVNENLMKATADKYHILLTSNKGKILLLGEKQHKIVKRKICLEL